MGQHEHGFDRKVRDYLCCLCNRVVSHGKGRDIVSTLHVSCYEVYL